MTKCQTGGPDGDLGGNEILVSHEKTLCIVDGSGVLYDPLGLNREELLKCVHSHKMIDHFDVNKLSANGYRVLITDKNIKLPQSGELVENGEKFRNLYHTHSDFKADFFVPCGGRPKAIDINNVKLLIDEKTDKCVFQFIIEGIEK